MNKVILVGRLTKDVDVTQSEKNPELKIVRGNIAVPRRFNKNEDEPQADFPGFTAFGKTAEFLEKYGKKGIKFIIEGRIQTGSYENPEGQKIYTTTVIAERVEFAESKSTNEEILANNEEDLPFPK